MAKKSDIGSLPPTDEEIKSMKNTLRLNKVAQDVIVENTSKVGTPFYLAPELLYEDTR